MGASSQVGHPRCSGDGRRADGDRVRRGDRPERECNGVPLESPGALRGRRTRTGAARPPRAPVADDPTPDHSRPGRLDTGLRSSNVSSDGGIHGLDSGSWGGVPRRRARRARGMARCRLDEHRRPLADRAGGAAGGARAGSGARPIPRPDVAWREAGGQPEGPCAECRRPAPAVTAGIWLVHATGTAETAAGLPRIVDAASRSWIARAMIAPTQVNPAAAKNATRKTPTLPARPAALDWVPMIVESVATPTADAS